MSAPKMSRLSTNAGSMMPLPTVEATVRWKTAHASTLKNAAHRTACQGLRTPVDTTVAIEFAASWNPFMKSNASASSTSRTSVRETCPGSMRSGVFEDDAFDDVRYVLALVGRRLERLVYRLHLDDLAHVALFAEQSRDRAAHDLVGLGLEPVDLLADLEDHRRLGHRGEEADRRLNALGTAQHELGKLRGFGRDFLDVEEDQRLGRVLDEIEHV